MNISFKDFIKEYEKYSKKEIDFEEFDKFVNQNIRIKRYITIMKKQEIVEYVYKRIDKMDISFMNGSGISVEIEVLLSLVSILNYTNMSFDENDISVKNYDILYESGLMYSFLNICREDYETIRKMFFWTLLSNFMINVNSISNGEIIKNGTKQLKEINKLIENRDLIKEVLGAYKFSNPKK